MGVEQGMSNEVAVRLVLDQLAQEIQFDTWKNIKDTVNPTFRTTEIERVAELGFVAGQKQKETEVKKQIRARIHDLERESNEHEYFDTSICNDNSGRIVYCNCDKCEARAKAICEFNNLEARLFSEGGKKNELGTTA